MIQRKNWDNALRRSTEGQTCEKIENLYLNLIFIKIKKNKKMTNKNAEESKTVHLIAGG